jgi:tetratricopeptide (TPR) repeat protein
VFVSVFLALAAAAQNPLVQAQAPAGTSATIQTAVSDDRGQIDKAFEFIQAKQPAQALPVLDGVISRAEAQYRSEKRSIYTSRSLAETVYYSGLAAAAKTDSVVIDETWSLALFFKGYALIDLDRANEAKPYFDQAIAMAPMNSHYLGERAEWYKSRKDWPNAYAEFERAAGAADLSPDDMKSFDKRRAWRGMAYVRIEQGKLAEAETLLRRCLALDPNDANAQHELDYIKSVRR